MGLLDAVSDLGKQKQIIRDCVALIDAEVAKKSGLTGLALKAAFSTVKGIKPGFIDQVVTSLLPEFAKVLEPLWAEAIASGNPAAAIIAAKSRAADLLLSITDNKATRAKSQLVKSTYEKLRSTAKKHVEEAIPGLAELLARHAR